MTNIAIGAKMDENTLLGLITAIAFVTGIGYALWQLAQLWQAWKLSEPPASAYARKSSAVDSAPAAVAHEHYFV